MRRRRGGGGGEGGDASCTRRVTPQQERVLLPAPTRRDVFTKTKRAEISPELLGGAGRPGGNRRPVREEEEEEEQGTLFESASSQLPGLGPFGSVPLDQSGPFITST